MNFRRLRKSAIWHNPKEQMPGFTRRRLGFVFVSFIAIYGLILVRLCSLIFISAHVKKECAEHVAVPRFDVVDRNGELLATDIITYSIYVDPLAILDRQETAVALSKMLPCFSKQQILDKLSKKSRFTWIVRHIDPELKDRIFNLGLSGVFVKDEYKRIYPYGSLVSHIVGYCDIDNIGVCGIERSFDKKLREKEKIELSLDLRVQHIVRNELKKGLQAYKATAGNALVMDQEGRILASVSLPDFDSYNVTNIKDTFNRNFQGCYELGSVLKILNVAISLQTGVIHKDSCFDARQPVRIGRFIVDDFRAKRRILSLREAFLYSSNIAMIEMANYYGDKYGIGTQREYFQKLGILDPLALEVKELGYPILPSRWTRATFQTLAYGYGLAMPPVSFLTAVANVLMNKRIAPTLIKDNIAREEKVQEPIFKPSVSKVMEHLMREYVLDRTDGPSGLKGYDLLGKSGTALQCINGKYDQNEKNATFISCLIDKKTGRKFFILVMMETPKAVPGTFGFSTARWNCFPVTKNIVQQMAPILGIQPDLSRTEKKYDSSI